MSNQEIINASVRDKLRTQVRQFVRIVEYFQENLPEDKQVLLTLDGFEMFPEKIGYMLPEYLTFSGTDYDDCDVLLVHKANLSNLYLKAVPRKERGDRRKIGYLPEPPQD